MFNVGDVVITNRFGLVGIPLKVVDICSSFRICECEYVVEGNVYSQDFCFDDLIVIMEV